MNEMITAWLDDIVESIDEQFGEGYAKANPGLIGALVTAGMAQDSEREHHAALNEIADVARLIGGELRHLGSLEGGLNYIAEAIDGVRKELRCGINIMVEGLDLNEVAEAIDPSGERHQRYSKADYAETVKAAQGGKSDG